MIVTSEAEANILREAGKRHAHILREVSDRAVPGVEARELDELAYKLATQMGDTPAFLHYTPDGADRPFPASLCVSINEEIVHGIPNEEVRIIQEGDVVSLDFGLLHEGMFTDAAVTVIAGKGDAVAQKLVEATERSLVEGLKEARTGNRMGDIGSAISETARSYGFSVFKDLVGHGVGKSIHEDPYVPNFGKRGKGMVLPEGLVIAVEPMLSEGSDEIRLLSDGYTYVTKDGSRAAHFEHTIIVREGGPEVLTLLS
jgi:methionyl aminopeptidase